MAGLEPTKYWNKFSNWVFSSGPAVYVEQKLIGAGSKAASVSTAIKENTVGVIAAGSQGLKWGLILGGVILALFLVAQFKSVTAAFKE